MCSGMLLIGGQAISQTASVTDISVMVRVAADTCLATFPSYRNIDKKLAAKGLTQDKLGVWRGPSVIAIVGKSGSKKPVCEIWMAKDSKAKDVSDAVQVDIANLGVTNLDARRKGIRLSVAFEQRGTVGTLKAEPFNGRTSRIILTSGAAS